MPAVSRVGFTSLLMSPQFAYTAMSFSLYQYAQVVSCCIAVLNTYTYRCCKYNAKKWNPNEEGKKREKMECHAPSFAAFYTRHQIPRPFPRQLQLLLLLVDLIIIAALRHKSTGREKKTKNDLRVHEKRASNSA